MRRTIAFALLALAVPLVAQAAGGITVPVDQSRRLPIGGQAANVVVGNTGIADVRAIDSRTLMVVGKKQGVTNVVVLDPAGRTLFDGEIVVSAGSGTMMTVYRGAQASEYSCSPYCQTAVASGSGSPAAALSSNAVGAPAHQPVEVTVNGATAQ